MENQLKTNGNQYAIALLVKIVTGSRNMYDVLKFL